MSRPQRPGPMALLLPAVLLAAAPATARTSIHPYLEVQQVFTTDLSGHDQDSVTYSGLAAGVDAKLDGAHVKGQIDYRYDHYFSWKKRYADTSVHTGLASIAYTPTDTLTLSAAGIATRANGGFGRRSSGFLIGDLDNTNQIYAIDAGPHYRNQYGDLNVSADYDFGWTKSGDGQGYDLGPGQPVLQNNFTTISHTAQASVGMRPGGAGLPVGWNISGGFIQDNIGFLDARYVGKFGRADLTYPVTDSLAVTGGVGYETNRASQGAILTDADGNAILTAKRHLQVDHSKKRLLSYDQDGLIWDVGVIWRPSARTFLEAHVGRRYGGMTYYGRAQHQLTPDSSIQVVAYDDLQSFGRQLSSGLGDLPTSFSQENTPLATPITMCVFGVNGGSGGCLPALASVNSNFYRSRGVYANWSGSHGLWQYGVGVSYDRRRYLQPSVDSDVFVYDDARDQDVTINGTLTRRLSRSSSLTGSVIAAWYKTDAEEFATPSYWIYGGSLAYARQFSRRLSGAASVSVSSGAGGDSSEDVIGSGLLSLRYTL